MKLNKLLIIVSAILFCLLLVSVFKNSSYPLFWADESMTAIGSERVLEYGYPKVHDGKNVFYDLLNPDVKLGISEGDAYVGGAGWGQYYYGVIGYKLATLTNDIYLKTGIYRATFAVAGLLGLFLTAYFISLLFTDTFSKHAFIALFLFFELMSVSLALLLKEVRYYSLTILLSAVIIGLYSRYRFYRPFNAVLFGIALSVALCLAFITFSPLYFISVLTIGISELVIAASLLNSRGINAAVKNSLSVLLPLILSVLLVLPLFRYFKMLEISRAMNELFGYNAKIYWGNLLTITAFFRKFDLLLPAITLKIFLLLHFKKLLATRPAIFKASNLLTLFFIVSYFFTPLISNHIYTRYIIYLQPFVAVTVILDLFMILHQYSPVRKKLINFLLVTLPVIAFSGIFIFTVYRNLTPIKGHIYEMSHTYKGPLDHIIPYILEKYPVTDTLVIATNYEETSYMYYLKCKVIVGMVGNNLEEDSKASPHLIAYRRAWGNHWPLIESYLKKATYTPISFPVDDNLVNNIPELNANRFFNHKFKSVLPASPANATVLEVRQ